MEVEADNDPPTMTSYIGTRAIKINRSFSINLSSYFSDPGDQLTYSVNCPSPHIATASVSGSTLTVRATDMAGYTARIIVTATDTADQSTVQDFNVKVYDSPPSVMDLTVSKSTIEEIDGTTSITVEASPVTSLVFGTSVTVNVSTSKNGGVGATLSPSSFNITIPAGAESGSTTINLTPIDDNYYTDNGVVTFSGTSDDLSSDTTTITITNNDALPGISLSVSPTSVGEGAGATTVDVTASLVGSTRFKGSRTVRVSAPSGGSNISYSSSPSNFDVTISGSSASGTEDFTLTPVDDVYYTGDETVTVDADASWGSFEAAAAVTISEQRRVAGDQFER